MRSMSKPIRLRGLKSGSTISFEYGTAVEAYTASWIEISFPLELIGLLCVEAYTASWIEIVPQTQHPSHWHVEVYTVPRVFYYDSNTVSLRSRTLH